MTHYEALRRQTFTTVDDVDEEINALRRRWQSTLDPRTRSECETRLEICRRIRSDLQQPELFAEVKS